MKDQKLIYAMKDIDDDLICEAMKRRSADTEQEGEEAAAVSIVGKRRGQAWKYPVAAAALLGVMGGALFVVNNNGVSLDNWGGAADEETISTDTEASERESDTASTDTVIEETQGMVSEEPLRVVPLKVVNIGNPACHFLFTDLYPTIPQCDFGEEYFTEMSTLELCEYYGLRNIPYLAEKGSISEVMDEKSTHGIYVRPDGSIYDINTFTFITPDIPYIGKRFTITVGKNSTFAQEYIEGASSYESNYYYYNEEIKTFFRVFEKNGLCIMISGQADELSNYDNPYFKERFYDARKADSEIWKGVPCEIDLLIQNAFQCFGDYLD